MSTTATAAGTIDVGGDLTVNRLGFGAMRITGRGIWGEPPDREQAKAVLRRAVELGVNFIDTADSYGPEVSETLIAEALSPYPDDLVIATKGGLERTGPGQWPVNGRPEHLKQAARAAFGGCGSSRSRCTSSTGPTRCRSEESIGALVELKEQGKIRHIGVSTWMRSSCAAAQQLTPVVSIQNRYNVTDRGSESLRRPVRAGATLVPPLGADPGCRRRLARGRHRRTTPGDTAAGRAGLDARPLTGRAVIPGTGSLGHLEDNVAAAGIELSKEEVATLNHLS